MPDTILTVGGYELKISDDKERWYFRPVGKVGLAWRLPLPMVSPWDTVNAVVLRVLLELEHAREAASDRLPCGHPVVCLPVEQGRESSAPVESHGCDWCAELKEKDAEAACWRVVRDVLSELDPEWTRRAEDPEEAAGLTLREWVQQAAQSNEDRREARADHARLVALEDRVYRMLVETPDAVAVGSVRARVEELEKACRVLESDCVLVAFVEGVRDALAARVEKLEREDVVEHNLVASRLAVLEARQTALGSDVEVLKRLTFVHHVA